MERTSLKNNNHSKNIEKILDLSEEKFCNIDFCCQNGQIKMNILPFILFGNFWKNILKSIEGVDMNFCIIVPEIDVEDFKKVLNYIVTGKEEFSIEMSIIELIFPDFQKNSAADEPDDAISEFKVDDPYTCKFCLKAFSRISDCKKHMENFHQKYEKVYKCKFCEKVFKTFKAKRSHEEMHKENEKGKNEFSCPSCDKSYKNVQDLLKHIKAKNHEYPESLKGKKLVQDGTIMCNICHRYVKRMDHHLKTHHSENSRNFKCDVCNFETDRKDTLRKHQYLKHKIVTRGFRFIDKTFETDEVDFTCFDCKKKFTTKLGIENHIIQPTCEDIKCKFCGKVFKERKTLLYHIRNIHENPTKHKCEKCHQVFSHKNSLNKHYKNCNK